MKKIKLLAFLCFSALAVSCSSDSNGGGSSATGDFDFSENGTAGVVSVSQAIRSEDTFFVTADLEDGGSFEIDFDVHGNLGKAQYYPADPMASTMTSSFNFSSHYFNFELVSLNQSAKTVKVNYSGKVYEDEYDMDSPFTEISGSFYLNYTDVTSQVAEDSRGFIVSAKIGGNDWYSTNSYTTDGNVDIGTDYIEHYVSDDAYKIMLHYDEENTPAGNYVFNSQSNGHMVQLAKFDPVTKEYVIYNGVGNMNVTTNGDIGFTLHYLEGTYSFTATNPNDPSDVIQVTNGKFKSLY